MEISLNSKLEGGKFLSLKTKACFTVSMPIPLAPRKSTLLWWYATLPIQQHPSEKWLSTMLFSLVCERKMKSRVGVCCCWTGGVIKGRTKKFIKHITYNMEQPREWIEAQKKEEKLTRFFIVKIHWMSLSGFRFKRIRNPCKCNKLELNFTSIFVGFKREKRKISPQNHRIFSLLSLLL